MGIPRDFLALAQKKGKIFTGKCGRTLNSIGIYSIEYCIGCRNATAEDEGLEKYISLNFCHMIYMEFRP